MGKTLVIFDVDGTLVYSNRIDSQCFATTYQSIYKQPFPSIDWRRYPHVTDHTIFSSVIQEHFGRAVTQEEIHDFQDQFVGLLEQKRVETPLEFLAVLHAREAVVQLLSNPDFVVGIGTGGWKRPAKLKLRHVEIPTENLIISAADGKETREQILGEVVDRAQAQHASFDKTVYIGDAVWDVQTTRNMAMDFIGIRREGDLHVLEDLGATHVLQDYSNFDHLLDAIRNARPPREVGAL